MLGGGRKRIELGVRDYNNFWFHQKLQRDPKKVECSFAQKRSNAPPTNTATNSGAMPDFFLGNQQGVGVITPNLAVFLGLLLKFPNWWQKKYGSARASQKRCLALQKHRFFQANIH